MTRQSELGARVGWSPTGLMITVKWGQKGGVEIGELEEVDRKLYRRNLLEFLPANYAEKTPWFN